MPMQNMHDLKDKVDLNLSRESIPRARHHDH